MNKQELQEIIDANLKKMKWATMTNIWKVGIKYGRLDSGTLAETEFQPAYKRATITFDPECFAEAQEEDVLDTLRHELLHLTLASLDDCARSAFNQLPGASNEAYTHWYHHCIEECINNLEAMLDHGLQKNGTAMVNQEFEHIE